MQRTKIVTFGEIMMRLSTPAFARFTQASSMQILYAGAEANVAVSLAHFGFKTEHVTAFPNNDLGYAAKNALLSYGVGTGNIKFREGRLGLYFLENGVAQRSPRIIYDRYDSVFSKITRGDFDWSNILSDAQWLHWTGITPAISSGAADVMLEALKAAKSREITISGDINYRRNLWQYGKQAKDVMPQLIELTDKVIGGPTDFENCASIKSNSFEEGCAAMVKRFPNITHIATTNRETVTATHNNLSGSLWNGQKLLQSRTYEINPIVDRVGAGDAFMAGLIAGWLMKKTDQDALEFATAAGVWKHSVEGDSNIATVAEIEALAKGENTGRLLR